MTSLDTRWEDKHFRLFFVFLVEGLVDLSWESLNFSNTPKYWKRWLFYPKMASRLGKHLYRAKSKTENFGLFALYPYIFYLLFPFSMANFWLLLRKQSHSHDVNHCIWAINFWSKGDSGVGSLLYISLSAHWAFITMA